MKWHLLALPVLLALGCQQHYYRITEVQSGKEFYTKAWLPGVYGRYGEAHFKELSTGDEIVLQSSRARRVTETEAMNPMNKQE